MAYPVNRCHNIPVGHGMRGSRFENNLDDMQAAPTAEMALRHPGLIVGIKTAHYSGPEFLPVERAVEAGTIANIPVMVDFGQAHHDRSLADLLEELGGTPGNAEPIDLKRAVVGIQAAATQALFTACAAVGLGDRIRIIAELKEGADV